MGFIEGSETVDAARLRERNVPQQARNDEEARAAVLELNAQEEEEQKCEKDKKTFGRTPDGIVFTVPSTHDMVSQLLSPSEPKNISDLLVLLVLGLHIYALWALPKSQRIPLFASAFIFWRASYNLGIGCLLQLQSHHGRLVRWAKKSGIFVNPKTGHNPHPRLYAFMKRELETKIPKDYQFEQAPIEYNTWLVFRRVVDLILMCDFVSYCLFAMACGGRPLGETTWVTTARWVAGMTLVAFNLWVKLDAHRVVKDFAWYWGDFFYLIDQELTFDGVFEMAPHPMYSVGYAGYYGISLMAASYKVLFISIAAHAAQFIFLVWVENPHIERTYMSPPPRKRNQAKVIQCDRPMSRDSQDGPSLLKDGQPSSVHNLMGLKNIDLYRTTDSAAIVLQILVAALAFLTPSTSFNLSLFVGSAAFWRLWYSFGIGYHLNRQSEKRQWTRHFLKYGESTEEAWRQWKGSYHLSMTMCYATFAAAAWKAYEVPANWDTGFVLLKHVIGLGLVLLQLWVSTSIYEGLGEFGWFFGDFFFDQSPKLTYDGIYRFLNNPERVLGLAGVWGVALITSCRSIFCLALLSQVASLAFIQLVERPHMQKLYGRQLRQDAGLVRSLKRSLPPPLRQWQDGMDHFLTRSFDSVEEFLDAAQPKLAASATSMVEDTRKLFRRYPAPLSISFVETDLVTNPADYSLDVEPISASLQRERGIDQHVNPADKAPSGTEKPRSIPIFEHGVPIRVKWTVPISHSPKDWIGFYQVSDHTSREITRIQSFGRWIATNQGEYDSPVAEQGLVSSNIAVPGQENDFVAGEMIFWGDKLWWKNGIFEFRYHHHGKHNVMAISEPFEIRVPTFQDITSSPEPSITQKTNADADADADADLLLRASIEETLLPVVRACFDGDPEIAPDAIDDTYGSQVEREGKFAKRVVFAVHHMFGVEFAPEVVRADGNVRNLAWRIFNAKKILEPYSPPQTKKKPSKDPL